MAQLAGPNPPLAGLPLNGRRARIPQSSEDRLLSYALLVSLLLHSLVLWTVYDKTLGRVDLELLDGEAKVFKVARSDADVITEDAEGLISGGSPSPGSLKPSVGGSPSASSAGGGAQAAIIGLTQSLLGKGAGLGDGSPDAGVPGPPGGGDHPVVLRDTSGEHGGRPGSADPDYRPRVELPASVASRMASIPGVEVPYVPDGEGGTSMGIGPGRGGPGGEGVGPGRGASIAHALLGSGGPGPHGDGGLGFGLGGGTGGGIGRPRLAESPPPLALTLPPSSHNAPPIDFSELVPREPLKFGMTAALDDDFEYSLNTYHASGLGAPNDPPPGYFRLDITPKRSLHKLQTMPKDVVFIVDTSSSVPAEWVKKISEGVEAALSSLNTGDRFNIVLFNDHPSFFSATEIQPFNDKTLAAATEFIRGARSGGYTDVNHALSRLLVRDMAVERVYNLVLISDGVPTVGVMDTRSLLNLITRDNDLVAGIHCVGVGYNQNRELLRFLAYRNKGSCVFVDDEKKAPEVIRELASALRYPIMKDVRFSVAGVDGQAIYPRDLPDIYQGQTLSVYGRFADPVDFSMRLVGHNGRQAFEFTTHKSLGQAGKGNRAIATDWAIWKLHELYNQFLRSGETPALRQQIDHLRKQYGVKTIY